MADQCETSHAPTWSETLLQRIIVGSRHRRGGQQAKDRKPITVFIVESSSKVPNFDGLLRPEASWLTPAIVPERLAGWNINSRNQIRRSSIGPCSAAKINRTCAGFYLVLGGAALFAAASI